MTGPESARVLRFGPFELDLGTAELRKNGERIRLQEQSFQILAMLLERPGEVVSREAIQNKLWPGNTVVEFDNSVNAAVMRLRQALADSAEMPRFVETVPRRGYRFIAPVRTPGREGPMAGVVDIATGSGRGYSFLVDAAEVPAAAVPAVETAPLQAPPARKEPPSRRSRAVLLTWLAAAIICAVTIVWISIRPRISGTLGSPPVAVPFTTLPGIEDYPAFSPDGNQVAYAWMGEQTTDQGIYVKLIGPGTVLRLTAPVKGAYSYPAWSPDGRYLAFYRSAPGHSGYYVVSALGGPERLILGIEAGFCGGLDWSPDGRELLMAHSGQGFRGGPLATIDVETGEVQRLPSQPGQSWDASPSFSPDGKKLAFVRWVAAESADIYVMSWPAGRARRLTSDGMRIPGISWLPNSSEIVFSSPRAGGERLWRLSIDGGMPRAITSGDQYVSRPSVARQGHRLAYVADAGNNNIWRIPLAGAVPVAAGAATRLVYSTRYQEAPQYSPDGAKIAYASDRSGSNEIWVSDAEGRTAVQLTHFGGPATGSARWSPDGRWLAFDTRVHSNPDIYVIRADGGAPKRVTTNEAEDVVPSWSHDGRWIYFASNRSGSFQIWKVQAATGDTSSTPAVQVTYQGGFDPFESADGKYIYFNRSRDQPALWRLRSSDAREEPVIDSLQDWGWWAIAPQGVFFVRAVGPRKDTGLHLMFFDLAAKQTREVTPLSTAVTWGNSLLGLSPDGRFIAYTQIDQDGSDIMLLENFR